MNWRQLVDLLERRVPAGSVTTYAQVSLRANGVPKKNQPVGAMLRGARNNEYRTLTNRVVGSDGKLADLPDGSDQQQRQLLDEGVPFTSGGRVDFARISPETLA